MLLEVSPTHVNRRGIVLVHHCARFGLFRLSWHDCDQAEKAVLQTSGGHIVDQALIIRVDLDGLELLELGSRFNRVGGGVGRAWQRFLSFNLNLETVNLSGLNEQT